ncbi:SMI1/KNR4 family protein [Flavobacterium luteolum]|uniref:SMI1/KNR4 family protein n=1 Tax=Flavobacterium luteolum TaxID=3003259 RepID=UPI00248E9E4E|nr:SMI1/KNR4 family protein [Flavobacterium luteolum]
MRKLTLSDRFFPHQYSRIENEMGIKIPDTIKYFISEYADLSVKENKFVNNDGKLFEISQFINYRLMYDFIKEFKEEGLGKKLPLAIDDGGWVFCISFDEECMGEILLYQMEMEWKTKNDAFELVANSFEEFINGLREETSVPL